MCTRKKLAKIWNNIQNFDEAVWDLGYARNEKKTFIWIWSQVVLWIALWTPINVIGMYAFNETWLKNISYMIIYVGSSLSVIKFSGLVMMLGQRFTDLTYIVEKNAPPTPRWMTSIPSVNYKLIEHLYDDLMVISESLNLIHSWPMMLWLINLCLHSVSDMYFVISFILDQEDMIFRWDFVCLVTWIMAFISQLVMLNYACHSTSYKVLCWIFYKILLLFIYSS